MTQLSAPTSSHDSPPIRQRNPVKSGMKLPKWLMPWVMIIGGVFLLGAILLPSMCGGGGRETANRVKCAANMKQIGNALKMFADEHGGQFPDQLSELIATEDLTPSVFVCPSGTAEASTASSPTQVASELLNPRYCSYLYIKQNAGKADQAVVIEFLKDHDEDGMNVLFGDGHVEFMPYRKSKPDSLAGMGIPELLLNSQIRQ